MKEIEKVWGKENWITKSDKYCGKMLELKDGYVSSYHKHLQKEETLWVLDGRVLLKLEGEEYILQKDSVVHIGPGDFHSFEGISDAKIIEFSSFHSEDDIIRQTESQKIEKELSEEEQREPEQPKEEIQEIKSEEQIEPKPEENKDIQDILKTTEEEIEKKKEGK